MSVYLSIIVPLFNEEESVEKLVEKISEVGRHFDFAYELILVDDGSTDSTWQTIERLSAVMSAYTGNQTTSQFRADKRHGRRI